MDVLKTAREIGLFETAINLAKVRSSFDVAQKVGASMPLPDEGIEHRIKQAAQWLLRFGKRKYFFLTPELALIEEMTKQADKELEFLLAVPCDLEQEAKDRLCDNLPLSVKVCILPEPFFDPTLFPSNGMMVVCGYSACDRAMVLPDTFRMLEHYSIFRGKKVFVPYIELENAMRYKSWMEVCREKLSVKWRNEA